MECGDYKTSGIAIGQGDYGSVYNSCDKNGICGSNVIKFGAINKFGEVVDNFDRPYDADEDYVKRGDYTIDEEKQLLDELYRNHIGVEIKHLEKNKQEYCYVMEKLNKNFARDFEGEDVDTNIQKFHRCLQVALIARLFARLKHAGISHGDIKQDNIMRKGEIHWTKYPRVQEYEYLFIDPYPNRHTDDWGMKNVYDYIIKYSTKREYLKFFVILANSTIQYNTTFDEIKEMISDYLEVQFTGRKSVKRCKRKRRSRKIIAKVK